MIELSPFLARGALYPRSPVVLSVPHAGRHYPASVLDVARVPVEALRGLEDRHADALIEAAVAEGAAAVIAQTARAAIDLNRDPREIDPAMIEGLAKDRPLLPSQKLRGGLGLVPRRLASCGELWKQRISTIELDRRISAWHAPFHDVIAARLIAARDIYGVAYLIDCHSMPPLSRSGTGVRAQIVLGDRFGKSASVEPIAVALGVLRRSGLPCGHNQPYAGGYTLDRHGRPRDGIHAIQIEIDRTLYLDDGMTLMTEGTRRCARIIADLAAELSSLASRSVPIAAE